MDAIRNRYRLDRPILADAANKLYAGRDLSFVRDVLIYRIPADEENRRLEEIQRIGAASRLTDDQFMHILDVGFDNSGVLAVMSRCEGQPLLDELERRRFAVPEILSLVFELGQGLQRAMEERIFDFSVAARNLWYSGSSLKVIQYWSEGPRHQCGASGLCLLLYQMCLSAEKAPDSFQEYEFRLRQGLSSISAEHREAILALARPFYRQEASLATFMLELHDLLGQMGRSSPAAVRPRPPAFEISSPPVEEMEEVEEESEEEEPDTKSGMRLRTWLLIGAALIGVMFGFGYGAGWAVDTFTASSASEGGSAVERTASAPSPGPVAALTGTAAPSSGAATPSRELGASAGKPAAAAPREKAETARPEAQGGTRAETVNIPNLVGLSQAEAEKQALAQGLRYRYFLEPNAERSGVVFRQDPPSGAAGQKGDQITFWVSKGPAR